MAEVSTDTGTLEAPLNVAAGVGKRVGVKVGGGWQHVVELQLHDKGHNALYSFPL